MNEDSDARRTLTAANGGPYSDVFGEDFTTASHPNSGVDILPSPGVTETESGCSVSLSEFFMAYSSSATVPLITSAGGKVNAPEMNHSLEKQGDSTGVSQSEVAVKVKKKAGMLDKTVSLCEHCHTLWQRLFPLGYRPECKALLTTAWPISVTYFLQFTLQLTSVLFCGHMGRTYLDSIALGNMVLNMSGISVLIGLSFACDTLFAQTFGSKNKKHMSVILQRSVLVLLLSCLPCWGILVNTEHLLDFVGQEKNVSRLAGQFVMASLPTLPAQALQIVLTKYLQCQSIVVPSMLIFLILNLTNIGLHAVLMFALKLGVRGSAISICLSYWLIFFFHVWYIRGNKVHNIPWDGWSSACFREWGQFLRLAVPGLLMICLQWWCVDIFTVLAGLLSQVELAAHTITYQLSILLFMIPLGLSVSVGVRVGNHLGAGNPSGAVNSAKVSLSMTCVWSLFMAIMMLAVKSLAPYAFTAESSVVLSSIRLIPKMVLLQVADSIQCVACSVVRGSGRQRLGAVINLVAYYCIATPISTLLMFKTPLRIVGAWWGFVLGASFQAVAFLVVVGFTNWTEETERAQVRAGVKEKIRKTISTDEHSGAETVTSEGRNGVRHGTDNEGLVNDLGASITKDTDMDILNDGKRRNTTPIEEPWRAVSLSGVQPAVSTTIHGYRFLTNKQLVFRRSLAFMCCAVVLLVGIMINVCVTRTKTPPKSCILVSGSEVNHTWMSFELHHRESFRSLSQRDQEMLNVTFWYEMSHHWNKTFLYCGHTVVDDNSDDNALRHRPLATFNWTRLYTHVAMISRPSG